MILSSTYPLLCRLLRVGAVMRLKWIPFVSIGVAMSCSAGLKFEKTSKTFTCHPLQATEVVDFNFTNSGSEPATILELKPNCGCTSGKVDKKAYAPGESGVVHVTFDLRKRPGAQRKGLTVKTGDGSIGLYVSTTIPKTFEPSTKRLVWNAGEARSPKSCRITSRHKDPFKLIKAVPVHEGVEAELKTIREGYEYELVISPSDTIKNTLVKITLYPELPEGMTAGRTFSVYALLK